MPAKKIPKVHKFHEGSGDDQLPVFVFIIEKEGHGVYGKVEIELFVKKAPKACDLFLQSCLFPPAGEKKYAKRVSFKRQRFVRLTNECLQVGDYSAIHSVPVGEMEAEIGRVVHEVGVVSLCRSSSSFDDSFFFCLTDDRVELDSLDKRHIAFGKVIDGLDVILSLQDSLLPYVKSGCLLEGSPYFILEILPKSVSISPTQ